MTTYLDYADRVVDVAAFRGQKEQGDTQLSMTLVDDESGGEVCTGAQMLAQAWLLEFLKEQGTMAYDEDAGCPFMTAVRRGQLLTETDVFQQFNLSAAQVRQRMLASETVDDPDDERFVSATLDQVEVAPGSVSLYVTVLTLAGTSRKVILPIPLTV